METDEFEHLAQVIETWLLRPAERPTTEEHISEVEAWLGVSFPRDYVWFALRYGGSYLRDFLTVTVPRVLGDGQVVNGYPTAFYESVPLKLGAIKYEMSGHLDWRLDLADPGAERPWHSTLVPIHPYRHDILYCFDFAYDPVSPPILQIDSDQAGHCFEYKTGKHEGISYCAPSFTALIHQSAHYLDNGEPPRRNLDSTPYQYGEEAIEWSAWFQNRLNQYIE